MDIFYLKKARDREQKIPERQNCAKTLIFAQQSSQQG
jgi:hypothetical protein